MKRLFIGIIIVLSLWNQAAFVNAEGGRLEVTTDKDVLRINDIIRVFITAKDIDQVAGGDILLYYDPLKLKFLSKEIAFQEAEYIDMQDHIPEIQDNDGMIRIIFGLKKDVPLLGGPEALLATLTFEAIESGDCEIVTATESRLVEETATDEGLNYQYSQPLVHISKTVVIRKEANSLAKIHGRVVISDQRDAVNTEVTLFKGNEEIQRINVQGNSTYTFTDVEDGSYILHIHKPGYQDYSQTIVIENGEDVSLDIYLVRIKEDVNRDGMVDIGDLVVVGSRYGVIKDEEDWLVDADLNDDEKIDILDILFISRVLE